MFIPDPFQIEAAERVFAKQSCLLHAKMGTGKTCIATLWMQLIMAARGETRFLIVAPARVLKEVWVPFLKEVWAGQVQGTGNLQGIRVVTIAGKTTVPTDTSCIMLMSNRIIARRIKEVHCDTVVVDEATTLTRGSNARAFRRWLKGRYCPSYRLAMSGTPLHRGLALAWSVYSMIQPNNPLGYRSDHEFMRATHEDVGYRQRYPIWVPRPDALEDIADRAALMTIYIESPIADVPTRTIERVTALDALSRELVKAALTGVDEVGMPLTPGIRVLRARQAMQKLKGQPFQELLTEMQEPALVFVAFDTDRTAVHNASKLAGMTSVNIGTKDGMADWLAGRVDILVAHPLEAAHGLNLQDGGRVVIWYALAQSLEDYEQGNARLARRGQKHTVLIIHVVAKGTRDTDISRALVERRQVTRLWASIIKED